MCGNIFHRPNPEVGDFAVARAEGFAIMAMTGWCSALLRIPVNCADAVAMSGGFR